MNKILIIGSGGREHALADKFFKDKFVDKVYCVPGNGGTSEIAINVEIDIYDFELLYNYVLSEKIDVIVVGPEGPLNEGIVDFFKNKKIKIFGPDQFASQLECSKLFARNFMSKNNIPQPRYYGCDNLEDAYKIKEKLGLPLVLKADGLAGGKGVLICTSEDEFKKGIDIMFTQKKFGVASEKISIEECLVGEEVSVFAVCDGQNYKIIGDAQDHKRVFDGDKGPNTGGMGAYSPTKICTKELLSSIEKNIIQPTLQGMIDVGHPYVGFLYVGLMIVDNKPFVIEFNVRMGDPETQVIIPKIKSSLFEIVDSCIKGNIQDLDIKFKNKTYVTVVLASEGYPSNYEKGQEIFFKMNQKDESEESIVFHAGTKRLKDNFFVSGGRVLNVVANATDLSQAIQKVYYEIKKIEFKDMYFRKDIGKSGL